MVASTTIQLMMAGNKIILPTDQRAYSWNTELKEGKLPKQVNIFLFDLEEYNISSKKSEYYLGYFQFEEKDTKTFQIINGKQRITTIVICLSALFSRLRQIQILNTTQKEIFEDMIKRNSIYRFETVDCDDRFFKDYVIDQSKQDRNGITTDSSTRIADAFDFFTAQFANKDQAYLLKMLDTIQNASCTTHVVMYEKRSQ